MHVYTASRCHIYIICLAALSLSRLDSDSILNLIEGRGGHLPAIFMDLITTKCLKKKKRNNGLNIAETGFVVLFSVLLLYFPIQENYVSNAQHIGK